MNKKTLSLKILSYVLGALLVLSVFKNISYPLLWADESVTAMCSERVVKYGYPKAHDGKNVVNDMFCSTPKVAVNEKDDAFIGGANWGQYYVGAIGYLLANGSTDIYTKTGIFRSVFAVIGLLALFLMTFVMSKFISDKFYKWLFIVLFLLAELISISMALHLREVRYYSPTLFFSTSVLSLYTWYRFYKPFHKVIFAASLAAFLWILFTMFSPLYFICIIAITITEVFMGLFSYWKTKNAKQSFLTCLPTLIAIALSYIAIYPLLGYFKTFELKKVLDDFYHFNSPLYWWHFSGEMRYFYKLELLWLALAMRIGVFINFKQVVKVKSSLFSIANFFSILFFIFIFSIPNIDSPAFTRYFIYMQPVISIMAIFDFIVLLKIYSASSPKFWNPKTSLLAGIFTLLFSFTFAGNSSDISGHIYEMTNQYKGPLDYTIPYIKANYPNTENLIIATNYEETSFMYYLKSKVVVGFVGNNLPEDTLAQPDIISYRLSLGSFFDKVFNGYLNKAAYRRVSFPVKDIPLNNIPELNFDRTVFNHYFKTAVPENDGKQVSLLIKM